MFKKLRTKFHTIIDNKINQNVYRRLDKIEKEIFEISPEILKVNQETISHIEEFKKEYSVTDDLNINISKYDIMFKFNKRNSTNNSTAFKTYLLNGYHVCNKINNVINHFYGEYENINSYLDFASVYGNLTRFLVHKIGNHKIWVSDIKKGAVDFQKDQFCVNAFYSCEYPTNLNIVEKFDFISVNSLFSHLPLSTFYLWFDKLYSMLSNNGTLMLSVHDSELTKDSKGKDFFYIKGNEDVAFKAADNILKNTDNYGGTFVSEKFMNDMFAKFNLRKNSIKRFRRALWAYQDVYIITKINKEMPENLIDQTYP